MRIIDQRALARAREEYRELRTVDEVCDAIATLAVRGAPAIGIAGAMGLVAGARRRDDRLSADDMRRLRDAPSAFARASDRGESPVGGGPDAVASRSVSRLSRTTTLRDALRAEATRILDEDRAMCRRIGEHGAPLIPDGARMLTHCNAGALATAGIGTALARDLRRASSEGNASRCSPTRRVRCCRAAGSPRGSSSAREFR